MAYSVVQITRRRYRVVKNYDDVKRQCNTSIYSRGKLKEPEMSIVRQGVVVTKSLPLYDAVYVYLMLENNRAEEVVEYLIDGVA